MRYNSRLNCSLHGDKISLQKKTLSPISPTGLRGVCASYSLTMHLSIEKKTNSFMNFDIQLIYR